MTSSPQCPYWSSSPQGTPRAPDPHETMFATTRADDYTSQLDLVLADGTVVYMDGMSRWFAVRPDDTEVYLGQRRDLSPTYGMTDGGFSFDEYAARAR